MGNWSVDGSSGQIGYGSLLTELSQGSFIENGAPLSRIMQIVYKSFRFDHKKVGGFRSLLKRGKKKIKILNS